ncbi:MAG: PIN domain-containing protein [Halobacteriota archaeon]
MIVIDTSVWFDLFSSGERKEMAEELLQILEEKRIPILEPFIFKIEFSALLARQYKRDYVLELVQSIVNKVILLPNPDRLALDVALDTGCRAADLLYSFS